MKKRLPFTAVATLLFLAVSFNSTPSDTAIPDPYRYPNPPQENQDLQDLARWVMESRQSRGQQFHAVTSRDLDAALSFDDMRKPEPRKLQAFSSPDAARRELLVDLPYGSQIWRASERHKVDGLLVAAIVSAESGFSSSAISPKGAVGLMQILPSTGDLYGAIDLHDPSVNLDAGSRYLARLLRDFHGDLEMAVAAYNAGPAAVARYGGVPPFRETRQYVQRVLSLYRRHSELVWERSGLGRDPFVALQPRDGA